MTFEEMLDQALAMLQRRGRVTYRALKLQFSLDDDHLEALKEELLYAHAHVVDDEGRGLVWTGAAHPTSTSGAPTAIDQARAPRSYTVHPENLKRFTGLTFSAIIRTLDERTSAPADVLW
jgi:hypothetical protein